jgi:hypothetical protein
MRKTNGFCSGSAGKKPRLEESRARATTTYEFVAESGEKESKECRTKARELSLGRRRGGWIEERGVDVMEEEGMDGLVPATSVLIPGDALPPGVVKLSVGKVGDLREAIANAFAANWERVSNERVISKR